MVKLLENKSLTREQWLVLGMQELTSKVFQVENIEVPTDIKVSCGFPLTGGKNSRKQTIGNCFSRSASENKINEIFISPVLSESERVLDVLSHEMIHAIDDCQSGHKGAFRKMAKAIGLEGKMTSTSAGEKLTEKLKEIISRIGNYPHGEVSTNVAKKQTTRNIKVACDNCGFSYRTSRKNIENMENNICNGCGEHSMYEE